LIDNWSGQIDPSLYEDFGKNDNPELKLLLIPPKTTSMCQPLDTYFNRELKYLARKIYSYALVHGDDFGTPYNLTDRNNILLIQSLLHFTLTAPIFKSMIRHSWFTSGLISDNGPFQNVFSACFTIQNSHCSKTNCKSTPFIRCSWCKSELCFFHFVPDYHMMSCESGPYN